MKCVVCLVKQIRQRVSEKVQVLRKLSMLSVKNVLEVVKDPDDEVLEMFYVSMNDISKIEIHWKI